MYLYKTDAALTRAFCLGIDTEGRQREAAYIFCQIKLVKTGIGGVLLVVYAHEIHTTFIMYLYENTFLKVASSYACLVSCLCATINGAITSFTDSCYSVGAASSGS